MDFAYLFMTIFRLYLELVSKIVNFIKNRKFVPKTLPPITNKLLLESAVSLAKKIRSREVTSVEVVQAFIDRIKETNPHLNAVVETRFEQALEDAKKVDDYLRDNPEDIEELLKNKPFFGVPFTSKEIFQVKGLHQTAGLCARKDVISDEDAKPIKLLKDAGCIVLGTTNTPELSMWWESSNVLHGTTNNPYAFNRSAGGSSGGEGSIISAAGSPMGIGTDLAGSIRLPAYYNGIFGHKGSPHIANCDGIFPPVLGKLQNYLASGPMTRYAADLKPFLKVLLNPDHLELLNIDRKVDFKDIKIFYMEDDGGCPMTTPVDEELKVALRKTVDHFKNVYNVPCKKVEMSKIKDCSDMFLYKMCEVKQTPSFSERLANEKGEINLWWEIAKKCVGIKGVHTACSLLFVITTKLWNPEMRLSHYKSMMKLFDDLKEEFKEMLEDNVIFLYPPHPTAPVHHNESLLKPGNMSYTSLFNILGLPVTQCPVGLNSSGLPLGVQVVGGLYQDALCISMAEEIERTFGGWVCPSAVKV